MKLGLNIHDLQLLIDIFPILCALCTVQVKFYNCIINADKFKQLMNGMIHDWETVRSEEEMRIMHDYAEKAKLFGWAYAALCESSYIHAFFLQFGNNVLCLSVTLMEISLLMGERQDLIKYFSFALGQCLHLLLMCYPGQILTDHFDAIFTKSYEGLWYHAPTKMQKFVVLAMRRSIGSFHLTAGGIFILSIETFAMDDMLERRYLKLPKCLLHLLGHWPHQDKKNSIIHRTIMSSILSLAIITEVTKIITDKGALQTVMEVIPIFCAAFTAMVKYELEHAMDELEFQAEEFSYNNVRHAYGRLRFSIEWHRRSTEYKGLWYNAPIKMQKLLILVMRRSVIPCVLTGGGIFVLSIENFATVRQKKVGQWPYQDAKSSMIHRTITSFTLGLVIFTQIAKIITDKGAFKTIMEVLPIVCVIFTGLVKFFNCIFNANKIRELMQRMHYDWQILNTEEDLLIMQYYMEDARRFSIAYTANISIVGFIFATIPLTPMILDVVAPLNTSRPRIFSYKAEYFLDESKYYWPILIHMWCASLAAVMSVTAVDSMFLFYVQHACGLFSVTGHKLQHAADELESQGEKYSCNSVHHAYDKLKFSIKCHKRSTEYNGLWYNAPVRMQKLLILVMRRSVMPCVLTGGGIFVLSVENFAMVIKTSVSYFTVLSTMSQ
ncbi:hypothetical protein KM043_009672 [Ampulex compressa]|nr:hypothetical protein KM043_009672 [Ampulex compressa]